MIALATIGGPVGFFAAMLFFAVCLIVGRKTCPDCKMRSPRGANVCRHCSYRWPEA